MEAPPRRTAPGARTDARFLALRILRKVETGTAFAHIALDAALRRHPELSAPDRGLVTRLVYGTLQWRAELDFALAHLVPRRLERTDPLILDVLRLGAYQLLHMDGLPAAVAICATVELAKRVRRGPVPGFVNAVLRRLDAERDALPWPDPAEDPAGHLAVRGSLPRWLAERWLRELPGGEAMALALTLNEPPPFTIRVNTLRTTPERLAARLREAGATVGPGRWVPEALTVADLPAATDHPSFREGEWTVQDEASMLVSRLLAPEAGETVADACSGPGGKTGHIAQLMGDRGRVVSLERNPRKTRRVEETVRRLGLRSVEVRVADLTEAGVLPPASVDRLLLDAPCSNLGTLRRHPEAKWRRTPEDVTRSAALQRTLLWTLAPAIRPGGVMVYSVCTVTPEEGEEVVGRFLGEPGGPGAMFHVEPPPATHPWTATTTPEGFVRTWPHRHGTDGFIMVRLRKRRTP